MEISGPVIMCNNIEKYKEIEFFLHKDTTYKERDYEQSPTTSPVVPRKELSGHSSNLTCYEESPTVSPMLERRYLFQQQTSKHLQSNTSMCESAHTQPQSSEGKKRPLSHASIEIETKRHKTNDTHSEIPCHTSNVPKTQNIDLIHDGDKSQVYSEQNSENTKKNHENIAKEKESIADMNQNEHSQNSKQNDVENANSFFDLNADDPTLENDLQNRSNSFKGKLIGTSCFVASDCESFK